SIEPSDANGLPATCQVMTERPVTVRRDRIGRRIGRLSAADMARVGVALAFVMGPPTDWRGIRRLSTRANVAPAGRQELG
ncbi:MAG TPA: type II toxin-antitoxin system PemK/MazF family toxin, partial [Caulobacteraceae bacterium]|nr:type II toxin-antitoxin system PemK/MazF family toxin [Caulobacteraceae bacterium]